jgi:acyl-CoA thioester hydrolase
MTPDRPFVHHLPVRYADTDAQGHVFFANYATFMDEGLTYLLAHIGLPYAAIEADLGVMCVYAATESRFKARTFFGDTLAVQVTVSRIGRTSFSTAYEIRRPDGTLAAEGALTSVCLDVQTRAPVPVPDPLRAALETQRPAAD